ncbi:MAG: ShlB/FhaC/HecB family hemolysin secretion/activation protein [Verrucomicrobiales bacterium]
MNTHGEPPSRVIQTALCSLGFLGAAISGLHSQDLAADSPAAIGRSDREAVEAVTSERPLQAEADESELVMQQLQAADDASAERVLEQLAATGQSGPSFFLERIEFVPAKSAVAEDRLASLAARVEGRTVTFADLLRLVVEMNAAYRDEGFPLARANLPPQDVEGGVVKIELIEARLGEVRLAEKSSTPQWMLRSMVRQRPGEPLDLRRIERGLLYYNRTRTGGIGAVLEAGGEFGTTDVLLQLDPPPRNELTYVTDNAGRESVGLLRHLAVYQRNNAFWLLEDRLVLGGVFSEGVTSFYGSYELFLPGRLPRLALSYSQGDTEVVDGPFQALGILGESQSFDISITQPLIVNERWLLQAGVRAAHTWSETNFSDLFIQEETVDSLSFELSASRLDGGGGWFTLHRARYIQGETLGNTEDFITVSGSLLRQQRIGRSLQASAELRYQIGDEGLPTSERFALGGVQSLRGYPESDTLADNGYLGRLEVAWMPFVQMREPDPRGFGGLSRDLLGSVQPFVFVDYGVAMDLELFDGSKESRTKGSAGVGLRMSAGKYIALEAMYAQPFDLLEDQEAESFLFRIEIRLPWGA